MDAMRKRRFVCTRRSLVVYVQEEFLAAYLVWSRLCYCVRLSSVTFCIAAKWCVLEQSYYLQPVESRIWEIDWYQNERPLPLFRGRIKVMSTIALHSTLNISETGRDEIEAWLQRTTNRKWPAGNQMVTWSTTSRDPERSNSWPQYAYSAIFLKQLEMLFINNR